MIAKNADINVRDKYGYSPRVMAEKYHEDLAELFRQGRAENKGD